MICSKCGDEFQLLPNKPGFANVCPNCTESPEAHIARVLQELRVRKERAAAARKNTRNRGKVAREKRDLITLGPEILRRLSAGEPLEEVHWKFIRAMERKRKQKK